MNEPVVLVNPGSGAGTEIAELAAVFANCRVETCPPEDLADRVRSEVDAGARFVGNGRYGENLRDVTSRDSLDGNVLDVRIVHADQPLARMRLFVSLLFGRLALTPVVTRRECRRVTIAVPKHTRVAVALDGEVVHLATPLDYESRSAALRVLTPQLGESSSTNSI